MINLRDTFLHTMRKFLHIIPNIPIPNISTCYPTGTVYQNSNMDIGTFKKNIL